MKAYKNVKVGWRFCNELKQGSQVRFASDAD